MSATQDKNQKFTFVYSNLYQIHQKGKVESEKPVAVSRPAHGQVLKTGDLHSSTGPRVEAYVPTGLLPKRAPARTGTRNEAIESLKENLKSLNDLHSRLRFMLQELEELVRE